MKVFSETFTSLPYRRSILSTESRQKKNAKKNINLVSFSMGEVPIRRISLDAEWESSLVIRQYFERIIHKRWIVLFLDCDTSFS